MEKSLKAVYSRKQNLRKREDKKDNPKVSHSKDEESLKTCTNKTAKQLSLKKNEAYELVMDNRHFLEDSNIVALSVGLKEKNGKETDRLALIFDVVKKLEPGKIYNKRIPDKVMVKRIESGIWEEVETDVVETGRLVFHRAEGGSAICAENTQGKDLLGPCTLGAILPNIICGSDTEQPTSGKKQLQLITSAHLIDYEEQHITKQLRYLEQGRYVTMETEKANEEFFHHNQLLFPVTGFLPVQK